MLHFCHYFKIEEFGKCGSILELHRKLKRSNHYVGMVGSPQLRKPEMYFLDLALQKPNLIKPLNQVQLQCILVANISS